jgi:hypothetical protein
MFYSDSNNVLPLNWQGSSKHVKVYSYLWVLVEQSKRLPRVIGDDVCNSCQRPRATVSNVILDTKGQQLLFHKHPWNNSFIALYFAIKLQYIDLFMKDRIQVVALGWRHWGIRWTMPIRLSTIIEEYKDLYPFSCKIGRRDCQNVVKLNKILHKKDCEMNNNVYLNNVNDLF